jgi:phosphatidylglycerophosphate synthase
MLDKLTRPLKDRLLKPLGKIIGHSLSPNKITLFSFIIGLGSVYFIITGELLFALILWIVNRIMDGLDGVVARMNKRQSDFGGYLDILVDFTLYALIPFAFTFSYSRNEGGWIFLVVMLSLFYVNSASWMYLSAILEKRKDGSDNRREQTSVSMPSGIVEGTETVILYTLFYLLPHKIDILYTIMSISLLPGIAYRVIWAWKNLK